MIKFKPNSNKFSKVKDIISFEIRGDFKITDPKNILTFILRSSASALHRIYAKTHNNLKILSRAISKLIVVLKIKNRQKLLSSLKTKIDIIFKPKENFLKVNGDKQKITLTLNTKTEPARYIIKSSNKSSLNINTKASGLFKIKTVSGYKIEEFIKMNSYLNIKNKAECLVEYFLKAENRVAVLSSSKAFENVRLKSGISKFKIKSSSNMIVYRPIKLFTLYPQKIGSWYDKTIEEVFFGKELV